MWEAHGFCILQQIEGKLPAREPWDHGRRGNSMEKKAFSNFLLLLSFDDD